MRVTITPERAAELLVKNDCNRSLSKRLAQKYARDMTDGLWKYNGDAIRVTDDGVLLDGQHRLTASIMVRKFRELGLENPAPEDLLRAALAAPPSPTLTGYWQGRGRARNPPAQPPALHAPLEAEQGTSAGKQSMSP